MGLFRKSDGAETAAQRALCWSVPGTQAARTRARGSLVRSLTRVRPGNMPSGSPTTRGPRWPSSYPGRVPVLTEVSSLEGGPGEWCQHSVQLKAHLPGWRGWVKTKPLSGLEAQAWPSLEVESKT